MRHHERCDGNGYPGRLSGSEISDSAKMAAIVDVYDALTSDRCCHRGMPPANALAKLVDLGKKQQFSDEHVRPSFTVSAFFRPVPLSDWLRGALTW